MAPLRRGGFQALALLLARGGRAWEPGVGLGWQLGAVPPWQPHTGSIAVALPTGSVLLIGGQAGRHGGALFDCFNCTKEVWQFDPPTETWEDLSAGVPWDPRWGHSAVTTGDGMVWMLFGCCEKGRPTVMFREVWTYNPLKGLPWTLVDTEPPFEGIQGTSVAVWGEELWVCGGWSQSRGTLSQVAFLSTKTLKWTVKSDHGEAPWLDRADHATAISPDGRWLFLYAGQHRDSRTTNWHRLKDTWRVALPRAHASDWEQIGDLNAARSSVPVLHLHTGWVLALGGHYIRQEEELKADQLDRERMMEHHEKENFTTYNDVLALDLNDPSPTSGWRVLEAKAPWPARDDAAAAVAPDGSLLVFGGGTLYGGGGYLRDVWRLPNAAETYGLAATKRAADEL